MLAVCQQLIYYITSACLCQEVFQTFLKFFSRFLSDSQPRLSAACILYHTRFRLSRGFRKLFSSFFAVPFRFRSLSRGQPVYYITASPLCQVLFQTFFSFFDFRFVFPLSLRQPDYYITTILFCQCLLESFFEFFRTISYLLSLTSYFP